MKTITQSPKVGRQEIEVLLRRPIHRYIWNFIGGGESNYKSLMNYPRLLSSGQNNKVIALSGTEVAKIFAVDTRSDIGSEAAKMKYANAINDLVVKFIRLDYDDTIKSDMLIMERIYSLDYRAYRVEKRELWWNVFEDELNELHKSGFVHHPYHPRIKRTGNGIRQRLAHRSWASPY